MADALARVKVTDYFLERLDTLGEFLDAADDSAAFDRLLDELQSIVLPNLARFPKIGRRFMELAPRSVEAHAALRALSIANVDALREYLHGDYLMLYALVDGVVYLLTIRHHRELAYDFSRIWPGT